MSLDAQALGIIYEPNPAIIFGVFGEIRIIPVETKTSILILTVLLLP